MKKIESNISLKSVSKDDFKFLFELLKERDPKANISHKKMPSYATHVKFIKSKPYTKWYVILNSKQIMNLKTMKDSLLPKLLSGEIRV